MQTARTDPPPPPYVPVRSTGWPTRRMPRWAVAAGVALLAAAVAVGLSHRPTTGQRATDLRGFLHQLNAAHPPESLASYHLGKAITALIGWAAPRAGRVAADVAAVLADRGTPAEAADLAALRRARHALDGQRSVVYAALEPAISALSPTSAPPVLHG